MSKLKKNLIINVAYQLFVVIIPLITAPYVSRTIGADGIGIYSYTYSIAYCFALIGMLGVANYGNRTIASIGNNIQKRSEAFWNIWIIQVIVSIIAILAYIGYLLLFNIDNSLMAFIQIITIACSIFDISWFFFGIEKFQITVFRNLVVKILNLILIFILVHDKDDLIIYTLIMVSSALINTLTLFPFLKNEITFVKPKYAIAKEHIKPIIILFFPVIAISIYKIMDKVMVGFLSTTTQTGYYEYAEKIIGLPGTIITAIGSVMLPRLSSLLGNDKKEKAKFLLQVTMEIMMCMTCAMAFGIIAVAEDFAPFFYGNEFYISGYIMMGLAPAIIFQGWANVLRTQYLIPAKKDKIYVKSTWIGAMVNLILNAMFIPKIAAFGAAVGTVCAEFMVAFYQSFKVRKELALLKYLKNSIYYLIPSASMVLIVKIISKCFNIGLLWKIIAEIIVGAVVYILLSWPYVLKRYKEYKKRSI